jgi:hypothetical protein
MQLIVIQKFNCKTWKNYIAIEIEKETYFMTRKEHKELIDVIFARKQYDEFTNFIFVETCKKIKLVALNVVKWEDSTCSCVFFAKNYTCYHIVALAVIKKLATIPPRFKNVPIGQKPKRGRPSKAKPALERQ